MSKMVKVELSRAHWDRVCGVLSRSLMTPEDFELDKNDERLVNEAAALIWGEVKEVFSALGGRTPPLSKVCSACSGSGFEWRKA